ncbi:L-serine dehydratase, partial [Phenoliferia sp. Uapishka_3]
MLVRRATAKALSDTLRVPCCRLPRVYTPPTNPRRAFATTPKRSDALPVIDHNDANQVPESSSIPRAEHAVISTFGESAVGAGGADGEQQGYNEAGHQLTPCCLSDLFSIGLGPSSSHTVGPMRAGSNGDGLIGEGSNAQDWVVWESCGYRERLTIAQLVWNNERSYMTPQEISDSLLKIWAVMDQCIHQGVTSTEERLPGRLGVRRRAAGLYRRLFKGFYPSLPGSLAPSLPPPSRPPTQSMPIEGPSSGKLSVQDGFSAAPPLDAYAPGQAAKRAPLVVGDFEHDLPVVPWKNTVFPGIDFLSAYAIAVNEVNASGGRVVTAPTNGAAGVIPSVLKYVLEFISDSPDRDVKTFLLTAAAVGMLYKRGSTISAAEGGCMAEVGVACSMAAAGFAACLGGTPSQILQAAEIGIEHSLGLTCDPIDGLVQVPCIERNSLGAVKAVTGTTSRCFSTLERQLTLSSFKAAQLALAGDGIHSVSLDEAIEGEICPLRTTVRIPLSSPAC